MRTFAPTPHLFAQREKKGLLACNSSFRRSSNSLLLPLALSDGDRLGRQRVHSEARQSYFSVYLRPPALELCDFYSGSVVPKLDLVWRRIFIASGCEAVATPPCRAPHCLQCRPDEVPPGPLRRLIPSPSPRPRSLGPVQATVHRLPPSSRLQLPPSNVLLNFLEACPAVAALAGGRRD